MADQPSPVSTREISEFLALVRERSTDPTPPTPAEDVVFFERKADLLSRIAAHSFDPEAVEVAAIAHAQLDAARARLARAAGGER
ncbi:hypothetical protein ACQEU5_08690 [Marinactinospora thermotolerans]|uniref:Uncharacterized protein n=1 Tax=Marinactinospora thermotolerans DSM 45154 TaxID=1122192 RepID=A0A1T4RDX1_9ACTN|nr:hypothetical protein [Marinactinospora thermotolerans]SKA14224.1 hypothetical protein SAMN02745673_02741 [Marinactinospora thermotolerans DSM 45154]